MKMQRLTAVVVFALFLIQAEAYVGWRRPQHHRPGWYPLPGQADCSSAWWPGYYGGQWQNQCSFTTTRSPSITSTIRSTTSSSFSRLTPSAVRLPPPLIANQSTSKISTSSILSNLSSIAQPYRPHVPSLSVASGYPGFPLPTANHTSYYSAATTTQPIPRPSLRPEGTYATISGGLYYNSTTWGSPYPISTTLRGYGPLPSEGSSSLTPNQTLQNTTWCYSTPLETSAGTTNASTTSRPSPTTEDTSRTSSSSTSSSTSQCPSASPPTRVDYLIGSGVCLSTSGLATIVLRGTDMCAPDAFTTPEPDEQIPDYCGYSKPFAGCAPGGFLLSDCDFNVGEGARTADMRAFTDGRKIGTCYTQSEAVPQDDDCLCFFQSDTLCRCGVI